MSGGGQDKRAASRMAGKVKSFLPWEATDPLFRRYLASKGTLLITALVVTTLIIWLVQGSDSLGNALTAGAKASAFLAISLLSLNFVMSARLSFLEDLFGGLDRQYKVHAVVGKTALIAVLLHVIFLIAGAVPSWDRVLTYIVPGRSLPVTWGILALLALFILLLLTVRVRLPYGIWKQTHRLMIVPLAFGIWHALAAGSDIQAYPALRLWVILIGAAGVISYVYSLVLYRHVGPKHPATVVNVRRFPDLTEVRVKPDRGAVRYHPGQFMFVRFPRYRGIPEMWPFSVSSWPRDESIRFSIKKLGDFTSEHVPRIQEGDGIVLTGPYGKFGDRLAGEKRDMIWIAGGIGITPFLSMAGYEKEMERERKVHLFWTFRRHEEGVYLEELRSLESERFRFSPWTSGEHGRLDAEKVAALVGGRELVRNRVIFMCGPVPMMEDLARQFVALGVRWRDIVFEDFALL